MNRYAYITATLMSIFAFLGITSPAHALEAGSPAPAPVAMNENGEKVSFGEVYAKGITLVYFYPKADTGGCTAEACSLRDAYADLREAGVQVLGVSLDKEDAQKKFKEKYQLPFPLIADHEGTVAKAFEVPTLMGFARRQSFLIKDGKIVWADKDASTKEQANDVRKELAKLGVKVANNAAPAK